MRTVQVLDWRLACSKCGRFVSPSKCGEVYAPYGDRLQYDGYQLMTRCPRCGLQEVSEVPTKIGPITGEAS